MRIRGERDHADALRVVSGGSDPGAVRTMHVDTTSSPWCPGRETVMVPVDAPALSTPAAPPGPTRPPTRPTATPAAAGDAHPAGRRPRPPGVPGYAAHRMTRRGVQPPLRVPEYLWADVHTAAAAPGGRRRSARGPDVPTVQDRPAWRRAPAQKGKDSVAPSLARKAAAAAAAAAALAGVSLGASAVAATSGPSAHRADASVPVAAQPVAAQPVAARPAASPRHQRPRVVTQLIGEGRVDGVRWSVALEFHRTLPKGYTVPTLLNGTTAHANSLLCQRMTIDGVRIDHQGGPWADCQPVNGTHDPHPAGELGLWGPSDKGTTGTRLIVANPQTNVAYAIVTLSNGTHLKATTTTTLPGTTYRAWATAIPNHTTITAVDQYDTHHHRLSHDTKWQ